MPPPNSFMGSHQMDHESHGYDSPHFYESYQHYENYEPYHIGNPPRFDMYHRNASLPYSRKYATGDGAYNFRVDGEVGPVSESNVRFYNNNKTDNSYKRNSHMLGKREKIYDPRKSSSWNKSHIKFDCDSGSNWDSRTSPQNDAPSPITFTTSSDSMSGSDSGFKYKNQTNSSHGYGRWHSKKYDEQSLRTELDTKTKKIRNLCAKIVMLEHDQKKRTRQLSIAKKQMMSKHHKFNAAKIQIEDLNHQMDLLKEQLMSLESDNMEKGQALTEQRKQFSDEKEIYESEVENLKMQLSVSKQLLAQKDEYVRRNGQQFQNWNSELTQKNYQLIQKHGILEHSYRKALRNIQAITTHNRNLQIDREKLQEANKNMQKIKREYEAHITRLMDKLSGWAVAAVTVDQSESESEEYEEDPDPARKIIPGECVPRFILDESKLNKEERTIKCDHRLRKQLKYSYKGIPKIPSGSVLKQIFQFGFRFMYPDMQKKSKDGLPNKSYPRSIDRQEIIPSSWDEKERPPGEEEEVEPRQLPDPESISKTVNITVFEKLHAVKSQDDQPEESKQSPKGTNIKN